MQKEIERKLNKFKNIEASKDWKTDLKSELFQEEKTHFLFELLQPKLAFGSLTMVSLVLALVFIVGANQYPEVEMVENKMTYEVSIALDNMRDAQDQDQDQADMMVAEAEEDPLVAEIHFEEMDQEELAMAVIEKSIERTEAEVMELVTRLQTISASNTGR